jgi:hypothetical protein
VNSVRVARVALSALGLGLSACDMHIVVGADPPNDGGSSALPALVVPWSSGFENGLGEWGPGLQGAGYCYFMNGASLQIVSAPAPVRSGLHAGMFTVDSSAAPPASHTRCVRQGVLPPVAYYGAWYFIPVQATNKGTWNLLHFRGNDVVDPSSSHSLWDVSLVNEADGGSLDVSVFDQLTSRTFDAGPPAIPINQWFHLEVLFQPAADSSGRFALWLNGQLLVDLPGIPTDDSLWGQFFVGNYVTTSTLTPPVSRVYVDDVTIGLVPSGP